MGPLPPFVGRRGLGKQCSMALYRQDPCDAADQSEPGIIRGSLPLELRGISQVTPRNDISSKVDNHAVRQGGIKFL